MILLNVHLILLPMIALSDKLDNEKIVPRLSNCSFRHLEPSNYLYYHITYKITEVTMINLRKQQTFQQVILSKIGCNKSWNLKYLFSDFISTFWFIFVLTAFNQFCWSPDNLIIRFTRLCVMKIDLLMRSKQQLRKSLNMNILLS